MQQLQWHQAPAQPSCHRGTARLSARAEAASPAQHNLGCCSAPRLQSPGSKERAALCRHCCSGVQALHGAGGPNGQHHLIPVLEQGSAPSLQWVQDPPPAPSSSLAVGPTIAPAFERSPGFEVLGLLQPGGLTLC